MLNEAVHQDELFDFIAGLRIVYRHQQSHRDILVKKSILLLITLCSPVAYTTWAAATPVLSYNGVSNSTLAYNEIHQASADIVRTARLLQENHAAMLEHIYALEEENAALQNELTTYKNIMDNIYQSLNVQE